MATGQNAPIEAEAQAGFTTGDWDKEIDVHDLIQRNYTSYEGDASFPVGPTKKTSRVWDTLEKEYLSEERKVRILDVDTHIPVDIDAFKPGYISSNDDVVVDLQTNTPLKRAVMPSGGWRMVETAIKETGKEVDLEVKKIFIQHRKTHNDVVFDVYTPRIRAVRSSHIIIGLPNTYGRGRIIGDYRRVALYGVDKLIKWKQVDKDCYADQPFSEHWVRYREGYSKQIKALKKLKKMAAGHDFDISGPVKTAKEAVQWIYFGCPASAKSQDGMVMSTGRLLASFDCYFERDLRTGLTTEADAQEIIDALVTKLCITRLLCTTDYDQISSDDSYWATWFDTGFGDDGRTLATKISFRLLQTPCNLGPVSEPNITIFWDENLPRGYKEFRAAIPIETSSTQYESDGQIREHWGGDATIAYCVSPMKVGKQMQFFGAHVNTAKALLCMINGGRDEMSGKQVVQSCTPTSGDAPLDFDEVWAKYEEMLDWVVGTYVEALSIIHYCHDRYAYESIGVALHDPEIVRTMGCGIAGLSIVANFLAVVRYAEVIPVCDETGLIVDYVAEGELPTYDSDDDRADDIVTTTVHTIMDKIRQVLMYRDAIPTQSVLTITSDVVYGKVTGDFPSGHYAGTPFAPGVNPENGIGTHGMVASMLSVGKPDYNDALNGISLTDMITSSGLGRIKDEQIENLVDILDTGFMPDDSCEMIVQK